ncbi:hypothetical protein N7532_001035 [Penicillium argentinense]|uniref:ADP-ribosylhydrolase ARH3 n=1 Tax=Penicillium argentinense TaxID=1131581 RepID=A0A9W9G1S0_9EURO|nr:uncharacterized protein N7532_001035 [Penicillium argentinense]KAJ5110500.1 hypothetical protein N7532_001035 [Penicillium argentinense]
MAVSLKSRCLGAIWGTCVADALGGPVQFQEPGTFEQIKELEFVSPFRKPAGSYSDDGSMTLALAQSIVDTDGKYNHALSIKYYVQWIETGRFSTTDKAWDVGGSTRRSLKVWKQQGVDNLQGTQEKVNSQLNRDEFSGNGSLMRIAPIGVAFWKDPEYARKVARAQSTITHPALACPEACDAFTELICRAMRGQTKEQLCTAFSRMKFTHPALKNRMANYVTIKDWKAKTAGHITSSGWVVHTLEVALWGFFRYDSWEKGALAVVNRGGDSDTAGAVYGALAGVFYGVDSIPQRWVDGMQNAKLIYETARLFSEAVIANESG